MKPEPASATPQPAAAKRDFGLSHDPWGRLVLIDADGRRFVGVDPVRAFPITHPRKWVSLCDAEGREVLAIESLDMLSSDLRQTLESELGLREFIPLILRIERLSADSFPSDWDVTTDRGPTRFTVDNEEDVRRLGPSRVMITDARRLRYQIPDVRVLDPASRRLLERFL
jgi:Domain of unknown function (DUF1854)